MQTVREMALKLLLWRASVLTRSLDSVLSIRPFRPFVLRSLGDKSWTIDHPGMIAVGGDRTAVVMTAEGGFSVVDLAHVASIDVPPPGPPQAEPLAGSLAVAAVQEASEREAPRPPEDVVDGGLVSGVEPAPAE